MELIIKFLTKTFSLVVTENMTIGQLKALIEEREKVARGSQRLTGQNGQRVDLSDDNKTLTQYGLYSGSTVIVLIREPTVIQVFLKNEKGQNHTYDVAPGETVRQFKQKVRNKEGVSEDQQRLIHEGIQMEDGKKLEDYGVRNHSNIFLTLRLRGG